MFTSSTPVRKRTISSASKAENVQVTVRCRPPGRHEQDNCWDIQPYKVILKEDMRLKKQQEFMFDNVLYGSDNELLYSTTVHNLINQVMEGYNGTVFAYGQTASGKTFGNETEPGVIPRSVHNVFDFIKKAVTREFLLRVSYLEIYNETIKDLLNPSNDNLKVHQDKIRGIYVSPLTEEVVTTPEDVMRIIERGEANRHISSTDYNLHSSRSHTMFQMIIESRERSSTSTQLSSHRRTLTSVGYGVNGMKPKELVKISQLNLIDLAGSEKAASNEERRKEGSYINKSLLTLGTVISKLTETSNGKPPAHIPFRDSKLTRILQTALTGQAKVAVICAISPSLNSVEESINTLKFASRVKRITIHAKNDAVMNDKALLQKYQSEIVELKSKLQSTAEVLQQEKEKTESAILAERMDHEQQMQRMQTIRNVMKERIDHLTRLILTSSSVAMNDTTAALLTSPEDVGISLPPSPL
ncbi:P-loop containing nucleoside triphosphate hydrolase protein [Gilbertella persicaria]|uniref:P-loop containing nucleoside triphosphate hydrolase protein n=1 Tax=Gilbertella persicaria TaxID=101096 RepID=UPI00221F4471|nr:P-loop containing nucleoside triphosphate hydrolase protein [Gilbertella persicaria]KAI8080836.1 P-loop containing nucleoside triphosphate hydrolase protein [Gilbertella persicaria]